MNKIICFSGIDGCGKGTQKDLLVSYFQKNGKKVFLSKAYGDAEKECFSSFIEYWSQESILFLFQALHVEQRKQALEAIKRNEIVIADRWDDSYLAYHSKFGILATEVGLRNKLNEIAFQGIKPDITFLLDTPIEIAQERLSIRGADYFDKLPPSYHKIMRDAYLALAKKWKWIVIDGTLPTSEIHSKVIASL